MSNVDKSIEADARRMRWLLSGNGDFMEEKRLCSYGHCEDDEQDEAREQIDRAEEEEKSWEAGDRK